MDALNLFWFQPVFPVFQVCPAVQVNGVDGMSGKFGWIYRTAGFKDSSFNLRGKIEVKGVIEPAITFNRLQGQIFMPDNLKGWELLLVGEDHLVDHLPQQAALPDNVFR